jgi:hypothetical protein
MIGDERDIMNRTHARAYSLHRRSLIAGSAAGLLAGFGGESAALAAGAPRTESRFLKFATPEDEFRAHFRFERDLKPEGEALTWYHFTLFAIAPGQRPAAVVRYEGMEYSYFREVAPLTWVIHAHNLSYPRDLSSGDFTDSAVNPLTGARLNVPVMALLDDPGVLYGPRGYHVLDAKTPQWLPSVRSFRIQGDRVVVDHTRPKPEGWPPMFVESSTSFVSRALFDDSTVTSLPCETSGFYLFPFPAWMQMGDRPGHMVGSWYGGKIGAAENLPEDFYARTAGDNAALLKPRRDRLARPLSEIAREALRAS